MALIGGQHSAGPGRIELPEFALRVAEERPIYRPGLGSSSGVDPDELTQLDEDLIDQTDLPVERRPRVFVAPAPTKRHAHTYIGLGLTPAVAVDLEKGGKGSLREALMAMRAVAHFRPFEIQLENGPSQCFDRIVFANISQMAKVATVSEDEGRP